MKNIFYINFILCLFTITARAQFKSTDKGVQYQVISTNPGEKLKPNDIITFNAVQCTDKDSVLFSTYAQGQPIKTQIRPSANVADLMDIFPLLAVNDSVIVKVPVDSVFKGHEAQMPAFFTPGGNILFRLKIVQTQSMEQAMAERNVEMEKIKAESEKVKLAEASNIDAYIKSNNLNVSSTASGLRYVVKNSGVLPKPQNGDTVYVNYTGRTLEGKVFDSSVEAEAKAGGLNQPGRNYEPISFALGQGRVIKGWDEGLLLLNEGSTARFVIPSILAYGERGAGADIKPYSTLVFDVELVKVVRVKHEVEKTKAPISKKGAVKKRVPAKKKN